MAISTKHEASAERGPILDRTGRFLAIQSRFADVSVWKPSISVYGRKPDLTANIDDLSNELAPILEMSPAEIREKITSSKSNFIYLKKQIDDSAAKRLSSALNEKKIGGVNIESIVGRIYPQKNLASQIIGFVGEGNVGLEGIEYEFDDILAGTENNGNGSHVILTIDANVQYILERIARQTMNETGAEAVMLLAMDPRTGDILGSASVPDFDPNNFRDYDEVRRVNRPVIWSYEPGSVFKIFSLAALIDSGAISENSVFICNGAYERVTNRGERISIKCLGIHGRVSPREIIIHSCNAGAAHASDQLSGSIFHDLLADFGFGSSTGVGSPGETTGFLRRSDSWSERSKPTIAIGQEIAVSAYQMIQAASAIANDGVLVPPRIISKIVSNDGTVINWENSPSRRVIKAETARNLRSYMVDVTSNIGTGWRAAVDDMSLAVKTGTAELIDPVTKKYSDTDFIASCIALLPAESPSLILYLAIIKPKGEIFGGRIAAPAIRETAESLIDYLGILRGRNELISHPFAVNIPTNRLPPIRDRLPDYSGIAKRLLLPLLLYDDINFEIQGDGWVRYQDPPAGTPITDGMTVVLYLE
ncbi:MAG: penicillin-binding protein [Treponema sp.]|nr:penicillin-binding protein [Treponema sp.]